jgi:hypothetical protein
MQKCKNAKGKYVPVYHASQVHHDISDPKATPISPGRMSHNPCPFPFPSPSHPYIPCHKRQSCKDVHSQVHGTHSLSLVNPNVLSIPSIPPILPTIHLLSRQRKSPSPYVTLHNSSASRIYFPSLYFSLASKALSYFQPTVSLHCRQLISRTICLPVVMFRSEASPATTLTTLLKRYALPCWPRKFCDSSAGYPGDGRGVRKRPWEQVGRTEG